MSSKFREHLSINPAPKHLPSETSKFSPTSTIAPSSRFSFGRSNSKNSKHSRPTVTLPMDVEAGTSPTSSNVRDRFTKLFFDLRTLKPAEPDLVPVQDPCRTQWQPLHIEKRRCPCQLHDPKHEARVKKQRRRSRCLLVLLIIILLLLIGNALFLNIRVLSLSTSPSTTTGQTTSTTYALSADAQQCLSQYTINAPSSPSGYPCPTCLSILQAVPSSYTSSSANAQNAQAINNTVQFCGLRAIYETANAQGQATLGNGSWAQNVNFCTWTGVSCDTSGQVASLQLTYPGVPATLPNEIGGLTALQTLEVIGGNTIPAGSLPSSFTNLTSLTSLRLEATSIAPLPNSLFAWPGLTRLSSLALLRNSQMGSALPSSLTSLTGLQNLLVNSQALLPSPLATLAASSSLAASLHTLDLTSTSLTRSIPSTVSSFKVLTQLLLGSNNLTGTVPTFPSTLQVLELNGNAMLGGSVACPPGSLQQCSVQGTAVSAAGCVFVESYQYLSLHTFRKPPRASTDNMISRFARSFFAIIIALLLLATLTLFHPPSRAYIDPWTGEFFGKGGIEKDMRISILPYPMTGGATFGSESESELASGGKGEGMKAGAGGVIMSKLGNETAKAELGRSTWKLLHTMTLRYPENPTPDEREALEAYMYLTSRLYPCGECAAEFQALLKKFPPQTASRLSASLWLCSVHNEVNARLGKQVFDCSKLDAEYDCGCGDAATTTTTSTAYAGPTSSSDDTAVVESMDLEWEDDVTGIKMIKGGRR
ncbi:hypothetical protein J3R82DRAFT_1416 [Butyriboletus roseoflavus]|nr:hypothetical protein J3R82DRAFT_1416 [Butyriboletus roseoflavus]